MQLAIIQGDLLQCTQGNQPCPLVPTNNRAVYIDDEPAATVLDHVPGVNIKTVGTCKVTGKACVPVTPSPWVSGSTRGVKVNDNFVLLATDKLHCTVPGVISIPSPIQSRNVYDE